MLEKTRGIFLRSVKYSESSIIAVIYTEAYGPQSFALSGMRSNKSLVKASVFQPLYLLDLEIYYKAGRDVHRLKAARIANPFTTIPFDIRKSSQVIFLAEILYKCLREEEQNPDLFEFVYHSMYFLDQTDHEFSNFHLWFLFRLTQYLGVYPSIEHAAHGNFFDLQSGQFVFSEPVHNQYAGKQVTRLLARLFEINITTLADLNYTSNDRRLVLEKIIEYYRVHFDRFGEIRSLAVLQEVLS